MNGKADDEREIEPPLNVIKGCIVIGMPANGIEISPGDMASRIEGNTVRREVDLTPDQVEAQWQALSRRIRRLNFWRAVRRGAAWLVWTLVALVLVGLGVIVCIASTIDVVI